MEKNIKKMTIKEIENAINEEIINKGLNKIENGCYYDDLLYKVQDLIRELFDLQYEYGKNNDLQVYRYDKNTIQLRYKENIYRIEITLRRKKGNTIHQFWHDYTQYYMNKIEIVGYENKTLQEYIDKWEEDITKDKKYEETQYNMLLDFMKNNNLTYEKMEKMVALFNKNKHKYTLYDDLKQKTE